MNFDWSKVLNNLLGLAVVAGASYAAYNPKYAWLVPVLSAVGVTQQPPNLRPGAPSGDTAQ